MKYQIRHETHYAFNVAATLGHHLAYVSPRTTPRQEVTHSNVEITPAPRDRAMHVDVFGNSCLHFSISEPHRALTVCATSVVELVPERSASGDAALAAPWEQAVAGDSQPPDIADFVLASPLVGESAELDEFATDIFTPARPLGDCIVDLTRRIHDEFTYSPGSTHSMTTAQDALHNKEGVCQDFAHVAVGALRSVGLAGRYVSGYLETELLPGQPRLVGGDASHAWASVRGPGGRWIDFDPTNDLVEPTTHITVAWGRDYGDVVPLKGVVSSSSSASHMTVSVDVKPIGSPRDRRDEA